jgi:hypothetical protein
MRHEHSPDIPTNAYREQDATSDQDRSKRNHRRSIPAAQVYLEPIISTAPEPS